MSVLIRGKEMPTSCGECLFWDSYDFPGTCLAAEDDIVCCYDAIPSDCPLVPVPPHGRLIDADAFEAHIKNDWEEYDHWIAVEVENRPTIIEAEEGE